MRLIYTKNGPYAINLLRSEYNPDGLGDIDGKIFPLLIITVTVSLLSLYFIALEPDTKIYGQTGNQTRLLPTVTDPNLKVELVAANLDFPTSLEFIGRDDVLVLEKNTGNVYRVINGNKTGPLIHIDVATKDERGLLGVAVSKTKNSDKDENHDPHVFLYYTECIKEGKKSSQNCSNYVSRYELSINNNTLINPKLILNLSALPGPSHNGGALELDKNNNLYIVTGDLQSTSFNQNKSGYDTKSQNIVNGSIPDGRAGILRVTQDGEALENGLLGSQYPLNLYYAYGIKNSFGIVFDPITNNLWDTENGPQFGDEINLVEPGFNSGWEKVQGIWKLNQTREKDGLFEELSESIEFVDFDGNGHYSDPEFVWDKPVAPTALVFLNSDKLGKEYEDDMFVGSAKKGTLYHFKLVEDRKSLSLEGDLADLVLNKKDDTDMIIFGENFGIITDLDVGPDGYLYILSEFKDIHQGSVYRIVPK
ncbi:quinoprotein glucose dehydrogenase [bacterium]|nr:MAG: quinoprotein glucose dehydrogenase [bacterium]